MNFLSNLFKVKRGARQCDRFERPDQVCIIDASGLVAQRYRTSNGQGSPRDHAAILKDLVQFASREGVAVKAVFTGRPLREAVDGSNHHGVDVCYADSRDGRKDRILLLVKQHVRRKQVVVLTSDPQVERDARRLHAECIRLSTFKKALEGKEEKDRPQAKKQDAARTSGKGGDRTAADHVRNTAVFNLIDPV